MKVNIINTYNLQCDDEEILFIITGLKFFIASDDAKTHPDLKCRLDFYVNLLEKLRQ